MNKDALTSEEKQQLKQWAIQKKMRECVELLMTKNAIVLPNECCINLSELKKNILDEL